MPALSFIQISQWLLILEIETKPKKHHKTSMGGSPTRVEEVREKICLTIVSLQL